MARLGWSVMTMVAAVITVRHTCAYKWLDIALGKTESSGQLPYGAPCTQNNQCQGSSYMYDSGAECKDGKCDCSVFMDRIFTNNNYECHYVGIVDVWEDRCQINDSNACINGVCEIYLNGIQRCTCNNGSTLVGNTCREILTVDYAEDCETPDSGPVPICDLDSWMHCKSEGKCGCYPNKFYDKEDKACVSLTDYAMKYGYPEEVIATLNEACPTASFFYNLPKVCMEERNMTCEEKKCLCKKGYYYAKEDKSCVSPIEYNRKYPETVLNLDEACESPSNDNLPKLKLCDVEAHMSCQGQICKCTKEYYPVEGNITCESKKSYAEAHNLSSYRVMPGVYCLWDSECITGLDCFKNKCICPYPCIYDNKTSSCDCGEVSVFEGASHAILVGVLGGIVIIVFWGYMIKKTISKGKETSKRKEEVNKNDPASAGLITSVSNRMEDDQIDIKTKPATPPPDVRPIPSYVITAGDSPATYPIDAHGAPLGFSPSTPSAPPNQQPPYTGTTTPYPVTPTRPSASDPGATTPYPVSPTRPSASDTSPSRIPYPVSPGSAHASNSTSFPSAPGTDAYPHSPVSGATPGYGSTTAVPLTYTGGDTTAPPAYTPSYQTGASAPPAVDIYKPII